MLCTTIEKLQMHQSFVEFKALRNILDIDKEHNRNIISQFSSKNYRKYWNILFKSIGLFVKYGEDSYYIEFNARDKFSLLLDSLFFGEFM